MHDTLIANGAPTHGSSVREVPARRPAAGNRLHQVVKRRGAEPYDALLWRMQSRRPADADSMVVGFVGCEARTGVTTVAANVAVRASELGLGTVLLVEADAERPRLRRMWKLPAGPGLAELSRGVATLADCTYDGPGGDLHVIPAAASPSRGLMNWDAGVIDGLLAEAAADHSLVLFDLPAADQLHHALLLARRLDQVLLVVRAEQTRGAAAQRAAERLMEDGVPLAGVVLNRQRRYMPRWLSSWF